MERWLVYTIWISVGTLLAGFVVVILWQIGIFTKKSHPIPENLLKSIDADTQKSVQPAAFQDIPMNETAADVDVEATIKNWLKPKKFVLPCHVKPDSMKLNIFFDTWPVNETSIQPSIQPTGIPEDAQFGYALDSCANIQAVGAPGIRSCFIYENLKHIQTLESKEMSFGCNVVVSDVYLFVQSETSISIYTTTASGFVFSSTLVLPNTFYMLGISNGSLFITDQTEGQTLIYEQVGSVWSNVLTIPKMLMSVSFDGNYVWAASAEGLSHWSKNMQNEWTENANWLMKTPLTTVYSLPDILILGEAHNDRIRVVEKSNPEMLKDMLTVPGGQSDCQSLFGDRLVYWQNMLFVSQPLDMNGRGGYTVFGMNNGTAFVPLGMQVGNSCSAQHASQMKIVNERTMLISSNNSVAVLSSLS
jgi:hypothetical protein